MKIHSKLPHSETSIFSVMSALAREKNAINLGQGFPDYTCDPKLISLVEHYAKSGHNQYSPMAGAPKLRKAIVDKINIQYKHHLNPDTQVCVTAGATQALFTAFQAFINKGDEVIIIEPAYDSYKPSIQLAGGVPISYRLTYPDYKIDWEAFSQLITEQTKMIVINTPHNPTGSTLKRSDLQTLERLTKDTDIIILSDEVYEHLIYDGQEHQSVLRFPELLERSIATYSFGKTLHATGWKVGYCVGSESLIAEFKNIHQWNVFSVNSFLQLAIAEYLQDTSVYQSLPNFFQRKRDLLQSALKDSKLKPIPSEGTYFQLYNYEGMSDLDDLAFAKKLTELSGVATIPLSPFYSDPPGDKVVRFCYAKEDTTLLAAGEKLCSIDTLLR